MVLRLLGDDPKRGRGRSSDVNRQHFVLRLSCPDRVGVVATVTAYLAQRNANVLEAHHFLDLVSNRSVMRIVYEASGAALDVESFQRDFGLAMQPLGIKWTLRDLLCRTRVVILVSKQGHCLNGLLHRWSAGTLPIELVAVASNHEDQRRLTEVRLHRQHQHARYSQSLDQA